MTTTVRLQLRSEHIPVSFAIITSTICKGPEELIDKFFHEILRHKNSIVNFNNKKHPATDDFETLPGKQQKNWDTWINQIAILALIILNMTCK